ncbi:MAG: capsular biosynthesis protein [Paenibacillaceae bacterium]|nr:MAG: capsular biosynthesis protein [Paenibacillaceae bacterium]
MMKRRFAILLMLAVSLAGLALIYALTEWNGTSGVPDGKNAADHAGSGGDAGGGSAGTEPDETHEELPAEPEPEPAVPGEPGSGVPAEGLLAAVGDIMMHMPQLPAYYDKDSKRYDFSPYFTEVKPLLSEADWAMANLETTLSAEGDYSGFPRFSSPHELAAALKDTGFNIVTTANNHSLDRGARGVERTLGFLEEQGFVTRGTARSADEAAELTIVERNHIRIGLLAYTYGTNGIPVPEDKPWLVALIDEERIIRDIAALREAGADYIVIALHFGVEYQTMPNNEQKSLARRLIAAGADLIAGSHPHVIQPYEVVETQDESGAARQGVIIYSMGNFISNQRGDTKDYGVLYRIRLRKEEGVTRMTDVEPIITWVHRYKANGRNHYRILPVERVLEERNDPLLTAADYEQMKKNLDALRKRLAAMGAPAGR